MGNSNISIVPATQSLIARMHGRLRKEDNDECVAMSGIPGDKCLQLGFEISKFCWISILQGEPISCFGVVESKDKKFGIPWMLATFDFGKHHKVEIFKLTKKYVAIMLEEFGSLANYVDMRNKTSIRWLRRSGFTFEDPIRAGVENRMFHRFWMEKKVVTKKKKGK